MGKRNKLIKITLNNGYTWHKDKIIHKPIDGFCHSTKYYETKKKALKALRIIHNRYPESKPKLIYIVLYPFKDRVIEEFSYKQ